ncbi:Pentatricopeptide repeat-containing protein, mitochondrial [Erysiphe neolycopersici]|uniref:Pentatricopeptide repeat-containing protein, mitochondrial n=1 Tax=Erysiphe neolycopersici TaxID=212602 RepID=A0A420I855_9PEZI|nr:Pentatricopeptide repeat-containing protein, mitochondrial [Erysiphe neolycopersici]
MGLPSSYRVCCCGRGFGQNPLFTRSRVVESQRSRSWHNNNRHQKKVEDLRSSSIVISLSKIKSPKNDYVPAYGRNYNTRAPKTIFDVFPKPGNQTEKIQEDDFGYKPKVSFISSPNQARDNSQIYFQLRAAINLKNHIQVDKLWLDVCNRLTDGSKQSIENALQTWLTPDIMNHFIAAYMSLQRPEKAINVWVKMVEIGLIPTHKTWNIMISGCKAVGDWRSSERIWNMMSFSGLSPDLLNWSSRLSVLMESKEVDMGIQALQEMGRKWLEKAQITHPDLPRDNLLLVDDVKDAVKPDISCVNIIIAGLLKKNQKYRASAILEWARGFGIQSNTETYNIFLRPLVRKGQNREAMELLKRMEEAGVVADVITYTIILDNVLRFAGKYSPEELKEKIFDVLDEMEHNNIQPNLYTYGKIIYQLIRDLNPQNSSIIEAVLRHMMSQNVKPSIHIYTNLVEFFFLQNPPNLNLAQKILDQATQTVGLDRVFWDRVVECYAQIGDTKSALNIISQLSSKKTRVGWYAMRSVLEALYSQKEWHLAKSLIHDVEMSASRFDFISGTKGEGLFWELAARLKNMTNNEL